MDLLIDGITLNGYFYSIQDLCVIDVKNEPRLLTENEQNTLLFCQQWLTGEKEFIVHTSGSTGTPKPIVITRNQMIISAKLTAKALNLKAFDHSFICLPAQYIAGKMMLVRGFVLNLKMTIAEPARNPFIGIKETESFDFTALVPLQLKTILKSMQSRQFLDKMRAILVGGSDINPELYKQLQCIKAHVFHSYGMTETVSHIALCHLNGKNKNTAFFPMESVQLGVNHESCLTIQAAVTNNELIQTNDKVELLSDNSFLWRGRSDNIAVSSSGNKIQLEKIERVFATLFSAVTDHYVHNVRFFVFLHNNKDSESHIYIVIEDYKIPLLIEDEIKKKLSHLLCKHERPACFFYIKWLPETVTGKIDKNALIDYLKKQGLL